MLKNALLVVVLLPLVLAGCSKNEDEDLIAYIGQIELLQQKYHPQIDVYLTQLLEEPEIIEDLQPMYQFIDDYEADLLKVARPKTRRLQAIHGLYGRTFPEARRQLTKMTEPNQYSLQKTKVAFEAVKKGIMEKVYPPIQGLLKEFGLQDQYSLEWPSAE